MDTSAKQPAKPLRPTVGLDKPCRKCGKPIYFRYKGPVEGLCGRCSDTGKRATRPFQKSRRIGFFRRAARAAGVSTTLFVVVLIAVLAIFGFMIYRNL